MATELFSLWGFQTGWRSLHGRGFAVSADLDGQGIWYWHLDCEAVEVAFNHACRRTFIRRFFPRISPPASILPLLELETMTIPAERTRAIIQTERFLQELTNPHRTPDVPDSVRFAAVALLRHYPSAHSVQLAHLALPDWFGPVRT